MDSMGTGRRGSGGGPGSATCLAAVAVALAAVLLALTLAGSAALAQPAVERSGEAVEAPVFLPSGAIARPSPYAAPELTPPPAAPPAAEAAPAAVSDQPAADTRAPDKPAAPTPDAKAGGHDGKSSPAAAKAEGKLGEHGTQPAKAGDSRAARPTDGATTAAATATAATAAPAETTAAAALSDADLEALVALLESDIARQTFVAQLKALLASRRAVSPDQPAADPAAGLFELVSGRIKDASAIVVDAVEIVAEAQDIVLNVDTLTLEAEQVDLWTERLLVIAAVLALALGVQWLAMLGLRRPRRQLRQQASERLEIRLAVLTAIGVIEVIPVAAFAAAAYLSASLIEPDFTTRRITLFLINGHVLAQLSLVAVRLAVAPASPGLRLLAIGDEAARGLERVGQWVTGFGFYGFYGLKALYVVGLPTNLYLIMLRALGLVIALILISAIIAKREAVAGWLRGDADAADGDSLWRMMRRRAAGTWHVLAILYVLAVLVIWSSGVDTALPFLVRGTLLSIVALLAASVVSVAIGRAFVRAISARRHQPGHRYLVIIRRIIDALVYGFALMLVLEAWGADSIDWLTSDQGRRIVGSATTVLIVIAVTFAISEILNMLIERYLDDSDQSGSAIERNARARTLLPLARKALLALLIVLAVFTILSELGIDVAPLIAGAGVAGIAIGFGAQSLVKDVISGFFILLENTIAVGDVVDIDGNSGVVESISVRTVVLRDLAGTVHTIPFGTVNRVKNLTKDFSYYLADVGVGYREDVDRVIAVIREVGDNLRTDPKFRPLIIAPTDVLGLDRFDDWAVVIKVRLKTRPNQQWTVGREFNRRLKARFDQEGIEIPFPQQTVNYRVDPGASAAPVPASTGDEAPRTGTAATTLQMRGETGAGGPVLRRT